MGASAIHQIHAKEDAYVPTLKAPHMGIAVIGQHHLPNKKNTTGPMSEVQLCTPRKNIRSGLEISHRSDIVSGVGGTSRHSGGAT